MISSASASTNSTVRPTSKVTDLSRILSYGSPSPPPPPASKLPPPPSICQSGVGKWKRITGDDEKVSASSSDNPNSVIPLTHSTKTGQVLSSASLPNLPPKQTVPPSSPNLSDDFSKVVHAMESVWPNSTAKPPAKPSTSNSSDDKKQGDVDIDFPSKKAKNGELAISSSSKTSAPAKAQASTSKRMWSHQLICVIVSYFEQLHNC